MSKEFLPPRNTGCAVAIGCASTVSTAVETIIPGGPSLVALLADATTVQIQSTTGENIQLPVSRLELGLGALAEIGRFAIGYQILTTTGNANLAALVYLGIGTAHSLLVGSRILNRLIGPDRK